jgi:IMP dehydrogenase
MEHHPKAGDRLVFEGLAYDDVLILPKHSQILPHETDLTTLLTRDLPLKMPLISAAMDTVTEAKTAIAMAHAGGLGIIHKNLSIEDQATEVRRVKKSEAGMVTEPVTISPKDTVGKVLELKSRLGFSGFPVVDNGQLVGIVTGRDIRFESQKDRPIKDIMTSKLFTAKIGTKPAEAVALMHRHRIEKLPVVGQDEKTLVGLFTIRDILKSQENPNATKDSSGRLRVGAAIGASGDFEERARALVDSGVDVLVIDTAHGHSEGVLQAVRTMRRKFPNQVVQLVAGNIATSAACEALIECQVDGIKVGIGPGSICTTRIVAGIGVPQFTAVLHCAEAAKKKGIPVIADGGIKYSGDIVKALAAGASSVMIGSLFAGTDEAPGELILYQGKTFKSYRGMGSLGAMQQGSKDRYFQANVSDQSKFVPEGIEGRVAYKGPLQTQIYQLIGGVRSAMGYTGSRTLLELATKTEFVKISPAALRESHVHDVYITREAPNYKMDL